MVAKKIAASHICKIAWLLTSVGVGVGDGEWNGMEGLLGRVVQPSQ
jgi:hypothetical protein